MYFFNVLPGTSVVLVFLGGVEVVCHKEGDMQLLGWTVVLLCQWILRKVSFSAPQKNKNWFLIAQRCVRLVRLETNIRHVHLIPECISQKLT